MPGGKTAVLGAGRDAWSSAFRSPSASWSILVGGRRTYKPSVADIVPHGDRVRWLPGDYLRRELAERAADPGLRKDLDHLVGQNLGEL